MSLADEINIVPSSFRDPSGFLFFHKGILYRGINNIYKDNFDEFLNSGLYEALTGAGLLIRHEETGNDLKLNGEIYKVIKPEMIDFISYPYEWCFSQLKDAALLTLRIQKTALELGMSLKDCSAYNVQFKNGKPAFIDTLSFEHYTEGQPWVAYRQFCQHFLAPLTLMSYKDIRLNRLMSIFIDGVPLDMASSLLPFRTRLRFSLLAHIHLHARAQKRFADKTDLKSSKKMSKASLLGLIDNLENTVMNLKWQAKGTEWAEYYEDTNYSPDTINRKKKIVAAYLEKAGAETVWDMGANVGMFSRIASSRGIPTISFDIDPACVEISYLEVKRNNETNILPLLLDLTNPSPALGWSNRERMSFIERGPVDMIMALALVHHLAISNNVPLYNIAEMFSGIGRFLIIEFVPKDDSQVQRMLSTREDIFSDYTQDNFENEFLRFFNILESEKIEDSKRTLYLMEKRNE